MNKKPGVYFLSGLGVDHRLFERQLSAGIDFKVIPWKQPLKNESIESYALRMSEGIEEKNNLILAGVSFRGMVALEMAKILNPKKVILISSVKQRSELPVYLRLLKHIKVHKLLPSLLFKRIDFFIKWIYPLFGRMNSIEKKIFIQMVADSERSVIRWAIDKIICWENKIIPENLIHIHGAADLVFPIMFIKNKITIPGGDHAMVFNEAEKVNEVLLKELKTN
jgi:pimeloyl-ACP methyl ester carboxylesterase